MLFTRTNPGYSDYKTWIPMTEDTFAKDSGGSLYVVSGVEPRVRQVLAKNVEHTESGTTKTISDWWTFPNWRRNAHTFTYAPADYDFIHHPDYGWTSRQAMCNLSSWQSTHVGVTDLNFMTWTNFDIEGGDPDLQTVMAFYPIAGGEGDSNYKTTNHSAFTSSYILQGHQAFFHMGNNDWMMYGDNINTFTFNEYKAKPDGFQNLTYQPYFCRFHRNCLYGGGIYGSCDYAYFPEFFMVWSTDQSVNPSCFRVMVHGFRSDTAWNMQGSLPSDYKPFQLDIGFKDSSCTTGSNVKFYATMGDGTESERTFGNDDAGSRVVNLGECNGRYYYMAFVSMNGAASRTGSTTTMGPNLHLLGGKVTGFDRDKYTYYYYTMPCLLAEVWKDQTAASLPHYCPTNLPYPINIRIHNFGLGFWGGNYASFSQQWGSMDSYDGWLIKEFGGTTPIPSPTESDS